MRNFSSCFVDKYANDCEPYNFLSINHPYLFILNDILTNKQLLKNMFLYHSKFDFFFCENGESPTRTRVILCHHSEKIGKH